MQTRNPDTDIKTQQKPETSQQLPSDFLTAYSLKSPRKSYLQTCQQPHRWK